MVTYVAQHVGVLSYLKRHANVPPSAHFPHAIGSLHVLDAKSGIGAIGQQLMPSS